MKGFMRQRSQRGDSWELRVYIGTDPVTGKQRRGTRTVQGGKRVPSAARRVVVDAGMGT